MLLSLHQPALFFATAKTHKLENINDTTIDNLNFKYIILKHKWKSIIYINRYIILFNNKTKFCPIINQIDTFYYETGTVIAEY